MQLAGKSQARFFTIIPTRGEKGDTPIKGVDYWTEEDKQEIIQAVLAAIPDGTKEVY